MGALSRNKGAAFERWLVRRFREAMPRTVVKRGLQSRTGQETPDVDAPPFWVEAKHRKKQSASGALKQAIADAGPGRIPIAVVKHDREKPFVVIGLDDFLEMVAIWGREL